MQINLPKFYSFITGPLLFTQIEFEFGKPIILYASPTPFNNSTIAATLLNTGHFVLQDIQMKTALWQCFDHPSDSDSVKLMKKKIDID